MTVRNLDNKNRFRSITVGFRVSPEENEKLNRIVAVSGLPKQEYCYRKCMDMGVTVRGNPKVYKALKDQMLRILEELQRIGPGETVDGDLLELTKFVAEVMKGLKEKGSSNDPKDQTS